MSNLPQTTGPLVTGYARSQSLPTFSAGSLNNTMVFNLAGAQTGVTGLGAPVVTIGTIVGNGAGGFTVSFDMQNGAGFTCGNANDSNCSSAVTGTATLDSVNLGRLTTNFGYTFYFSNLNQAFLVGTGSTGGAGVAMTQTGTPYNADPFLVHDASWFTSFPVNKDALIKVAIGTGLPDGFLISNFTELNNSTVTQFNSGKSFVQSFNLMSSGRALSLESFMTRDVIWFDSTSLGNAINRRVQVSLKLYF